LPRCRPRAMAAISLFIATVGILQALAVSVTETRVPGGVQEANVVDASMGDALASQVEVQNITFHTVFRAVPGVLGYNHMAMLEWLPDARRIAIAWQAARSSEGSASQVLFTSYSDDMGSTWAEPAHVQRGGSSQPGVLWSPVLHYIQEKAELLLFYSESIACLRPAKMRDGKVVGEPRWNPGGDIKVVTSYDAGASWIDPRMVYPQTADGGIPKVIANRIHVIERAEGAKRLILPFWRERARGAELTEDCPTLTGGGHETSGVLISDDLGQSWVPAGRIADPKGQTWLIEGTVASAGSGELLMLLRSTTDVVWASRSLDEGLSWSVPEPLHLPNPNSKLSMIDLPFFRGTLVASLNYHPRLRGEHSRTRSQLALVTSVDRGRTWTLIARLQAEMAPGNCRYHYPTLIQISEDTILVTYSTQHTADDTDGIRLAVVSVKEYSKAARQLSREMPYSSAPGVPNTAGFLKLEEHQFSASSTHPHCSASGAALYGPLSWCSAALDSEQWLQARPVGTRDSLHASLLSIYRLGMHTMC